MTEPGGAGGDGSPDGARRSVDRRLVLVAGASIVALYVAFRLALLWRFPLFYDESLYAQWALDGLGDPADHFSSLQSESSRCSRGSGRS